MGNEDLQAKTDEERARDLEKYGRYSTKGDSEEMVAVYLRALTAVRAEATLAERERWTTMPPREHAIHGEWYIRVSDRIAALEDNGGKQ